jgi:CheY-like chemotaxis protein
MKKDEVLNPNFLDSKKILLVEDNPLNQQLGIYVFKRWGQEVHLAENGKIAIEMLEKESFDLILMDIQMPVMDGLEAIRQIRLDPNLVNIPIIALTALAMNSDREKCLDAGANDYLTKPVKLRQLVTTIQQLLA